MPSQPGRGHARRSSLHLDTLPVASIPTVTAEQMAEVDRLMVEEYRITLVQMMENAGRALASVARALLGGDAAERRVVALAGTGGNGGGALAAARRLHAWGAKVAVVTTGEPTAYRGVAAQQLAVLQRTGVPATATPADPGAHRWRLPPADLVLDGIIGYGLSGPPRGAAARLIEAGNQQPAPVLALDTPSGLDVDSGQPAAATVRAAAANVVTT
jgi:NAD(P)H-hydrate epimerase